MKRNNILFVVSAPSGSGKTTLCKMLVDELGDIEETVSVTTRSPRPGEKDGVDYIFYTEEKFEALRQQQGFLEWASVFGCNYGTPKEQVAKILNKGSDALLSIDVHGAQQIRDNHKNVSIFIIPPSFEELQTRLRGRSTETEAEITRRLEVSEEEMKHMKDYDYVVVNDTVEAALEQLKAIVIAERCKTINIKDDTK